MAAARSGRSSCPPFIDGNKRIAFCATDVLRRLNGYRLQVDAHEVHRLLINLLEYNQCNSRQLLSWIRGSVIEPQVTPPKASTHVAP